MNKSKKKLLVNSIMLYLIIFSNYFFSFITVPYQTRILGPEFFGKIGIATAFMMYFQLFMDFGFLLSGTEEVAKNRENLEKIKLIYSSITYIKIIFSFFSIIVFFIICSVVPFFKRDLLFYFLYLIATIVNTFLPDYLYRGLEDMKIITYRTVLTKAIFTFSLFFLLKSKEDYLLIPILLLIGNFIAVYLSISYAKKKLNITLLPLNKSEIKKQFDKSKHFFFSRIASTVYTASNTILIKIISPTSVSVGYYTAADKLMATGKSALTPISDSVYPYMVKNKDFKLIKKILLIFMPIITIITFIVFIYSEQFTGFLLGQEFSESGKILRYLLPIAIITLPEYLFGFPTLGAMNLSIQANRSIYFGTTFYIITTIVLLITGNLSIVSICLLTSMTEFLILMYRIIVVRKNKHLWK